MSFREEYREQMRRDDARAHWESHVLVSSPDHVKARRQRAANQLVAQGAVTMSAERIEEQRRLIEDQMFDKWYTAKKARGFASFPITPVIPDDEE